MKLLSKALKVQFNGRKTSAEYLVLCKNQNLRRKKRFIMEFG